MFSTSSLPPILFYLSCSSPFSLWYLDCAFWCRVLHPQRSARLRTANNFPDSKFRHGKRPIDTPSIKLILQDFFFQPVDPFLVWQLLNCRPRIYYHILFTHAPTELSKQFRSLSPSTNQFDVTHHHYEWPRCGPGARYRSWSSFWWNMDQPKQKLQLHVARQIATTSTTGLNRRREYSNKPRIVDYRRCAPSRKIKFGLAQSRQCTCGMANARIDDLWILEIDSHAKFSSI